MPDQYGIPTYQEWLEGQQFETQKGEDMKLNYNRDAAESSGSIERKPGTYEFVVAAAQGKKANTGTEYINVTLELNVDGNAQKCFDNLFLTDKALFKLSDLCKSAGTTLPDEDTDLIGAVGKVKVKINDDGYYEVDRYVTGDAVSEGGNFKDTSAASNW